MSSGQRASAPVALKLLAMPAQIAAVADAVE
jgi:hypothetical protein